MVADEGHKPAAFQHLCRERITAPFDELQFLMFRIPNRENHPAAFGELCKEWFRNRRGGSGNEDSVERSEFWQAKGAVAAVNVRVEVAEPREPRGRNGSKLRPPLDREDFPGQT